MNRVIISSSFLVQKMKDLLNRSNKEKYEMLSVKNKGILLKGNDVFLDCH